MCVIEEVIRSVLLVRAELFLALIVNVLIVRRHISLLALLTVHLVNLFGVHAVEVVGAATLVLSPAIEGRQVTQVDRLEDAAAVKVAVDVGLLVNRECHFDLRLRTRLLPASALAHDTQPHERLARVRVTLRIIEGLKELLELRPVLSDECAGDAILVHFLPADGQNVGDLEAERIGALDTRVQLLSTA